MAADKWEENHESNACYNDDRVRPLDKQSKGKRVSNWWQWTTRKNDCYHSTERMMRNGWRYAPWRFLTGYLGALGDVNSKENWHQVKLDGRRDRAGAWLRQPKAVRCSPSRPHVGQRRCNARMSAAATHTHTHTHTHRSKMATVLLTEVTPSTNEQSARRSPLQLFTLFAAFAPLSNATTPVTRNQYGRSLSSSNWRNGEPWIRLRHLVSHTNTSLPSRGTRQFTNG